MERKTEKTTQRFHEEIIGGGAEGRNQEAN